MKIVLVTDFLIVNQGCCPQMVIRPVTIGRHVSRHRIRIYAMGRIIWHKLVVCLRICTRCLCLFGNIQRTKFLIRFPLNSVCVVVWRIRSTGTGVDRTLRQVIVIAVASSRLAFIEWIPRVCTHSPESLIIIVHCTIRNGTHKSTGILSLSNHTKCMAALNFRIIIYNFLRKTIRFLSRFNDDIRIIIIKFRTFVRSAGKAGNISSPI